MGKAALTQTQRCIPLAATTNDQLFIDVAQTLSIVNKRLYRQNRIYRCRLTLRPSAITSATESFSGDVLALNNTWTNRRAYAMAMQAWFDAHAAEIKEFKKAGKGNYIAKWRDFKAGLGATNGSVGPVGPKWNSSTNQFEVEDLTPSSGNYDWEKSTVEILQGIHPGTVAEFGFNWLASSGNNYNMPVEFAKVYDVQLEPDSDYEIVNFPYDEITDHAADISDIEVGSLQEQGRMPPYDKDSVDNILTHVGELGSILIPSAAAGDDSLEHLSLSTPWFDAPCGFIILDGPLWSDLNAMDLCLEVAYGPYKGVDAPEFVQVSTLKNGAVRCR